MFFASTGGGLDEHALSTTVGMLSYSHVANALHLAAHEFADLRAPTDFPFLESLGEGALSCRHYSLSERSCLTAWQAPRRGCLLPVPVPLPRAP